MEIVSALFGILLNILWIVWSIIWWILSFFLMPLLMLLILVVIALRFAYRTPLLKPYIETLLKKFAEKSRALGIGWTKRLAYSITVLPFRILFRFIGFAILHAFINLWWRPTWTPWERARRIPDQQDKT